MNRRAVLKSIAALPSAFTIPAAAAPVAAVAAPAERDAVLWASIRAWEAARAALDAEMASKRGTGEDIDDELSAAELDAAITLVATVPQTLEGLFALILATQGFDPWFFEDESQGFSFALSLAESVKALKVRA